MPFWMLSGALYQFKVEVTLQNQKITIDVDILVNKFLEILNSELVLTYSKMDSRFKDAALVLKRWSKKSATSENKFDRLNSFSLYMMLLAFMIFKKFIPNLQQIKGLEKVFSTYKI